MEFCQVTDWVVVKGENVKSQVLRLGGKSAIVRTEGQTKTRIVPIADLERF